MTVPESHLTPPLRGVRILMLGAAAAYCGRLLAGFGATTVLVEPLQGSPERHFPPFAPGPLGASSSLNFAFNAAGLRSVAVDTTMLDGVEVLRRAVAKSDLLVDALAWEPHAPWTGSASRLLEQCEAPVCRLGPNGPLANIGADDLLVQAASGHLYVSGFAEGEPTPIPVEMGKLQVGLLGAVAALSTLVSETARPRSLQIPAQAALTLTTLQTSNPGFLTWRGLVPKRAGAEGLGGMPYRCEDGWVSFTVPGERWGVFISWLDELGIDRGPLPTELDGQVDSMRAALAQARTCIEELASRFKKRDLYHAAQGRGILCMPMNALQEVLTDEHLAARRFFVRGEDGRVDLLSPFRTEPELWRLPARAPRLGEFTEEFCGELGYSRSEIESLLGMGAISCGR